MMNCSYAVVPSLEFTSSTLAIVVCYSMVFAIAFVGNVAMFLILFRNQWKNRRRVHSLLFHMTVAHLIVTLIYVPKEIIHQITVAWLGGDLLCRLCKFFAGILMCMSLDRFYSILFPLYAINAKKNVNRMLLAAWLVAFFSSLPQLYIFRNATHPCFTWYQQCVSGDVVGAIDSKLTFWFSVLNILQVYFLPLLIIIICYGSILVSISLKSASNKNWDKSSPQSVKVGRPSNATNTGSIDTSGMQLRRTGIDSFQKAKSRTLKMTIVLVVSFLCCWSPYTIAMFFHFLHFSTASRPIPPLLSKFLYAFAVFNSAISPYLYGFFSFNLRRELEMLYYASRAILIPGSSQADIPGRFASGGASMKDRLTTGRRRRAHNGHERSPDLSRSSAQFHSTVAHKSRLNTVDTIRLAPSLTQASEVLLQQRSDNEREKKPGGRTLSLGDEHYTAPLLKPKSLSTKGYRVISAPTVTTTMTTTTWTGNETMAVRCEERRKSNILSGDSGFNTRQEITTIDEISHNAEDTEETPLTSDGRHSAPSTSMIEKCDDITCSLADI